MANVHQYWIYIMSNSVRSVLYIGVTNDLYRRYMEHKEGLIEGFTKKYKCHYLLYYEEFSQVEEAIAREKQLKGWNRKKKEELIRRQNPFFKDLAEIMGWIDKRPSVELRDPSQAQDDRDSMVGMSAC